MLQFNLERMKDINSLSESELSEENKNAGQRTRPKWFICFIAPKQDR